jgi:hypothetical protein
METAGWINLSDEELLEKKISQLGLKLEGSEIELLIQQLYGELSQKGLAFHPPCHIGDEWFVPVGIPAIFVPFFLVHERLRKLERRMILEVEGETPEWFMRLMRHEAAHAYAYAFQLYRKKKWQQNFGLTSTEETPQFYRPRPYSRSYVMHLDDRKISASQACIELKPEGTGTKLVLTEYGDYLDGYDDAGSREHGTNFLMDALGRSLES